MCKSLIEKGYKRDPGLEEVFFSLAKKKERYIAGLIGGALIIFVIALCGVKQAVPFFVFWWFGGGLILYFYIRPKSSSICPYCSKKMRIQYEHQHTGIHKIFFVCHHCKIFADSNIKIG